MALVSSFFFQLYVKNYEAVLGFVRKIRVNRQPHRVTHRRRSVMAQKWHELTNEHNVLSKFCPPLPVGDVGMRIITG